MLREVEQASRRGKTLLTIRVEDVAPSDDLGYFLSATQWLNAFPPPMQPRLAQLVGVVRMLLGLKDKAPPKRGNANFSVDDRFQAPPKRSPYQLEPYRGHIADITPADIRKLCEISDANMGDVKRALIENDGDFEKAHAWLRDKGLASV